MFEGANTLRVYAWNIGADHSAFLKAAEESGLKVMATFSMDSVKETPVATEAQRAQVIENFKNEVREHYQSLLE